jgi:CRISPR-associated protein Csd2
MKTIQTPRELILLTDFTYSNPQGDPDGENRPRTDPETSHGLITAFGPKRMVCDALELQGHAIYMARGGCLERTNRALSEEKSLPVFASEEDEEAETEALELSEEAETKPSKSKKGPKGAKSAKPKINATPTQAAEFYKELTAKYIDRRFFGQLVPGMPGTCRGPIQFCVGMSIDPIVPMRMAITRVAVATENQATSQGQANRMMGDHWTVPYGLYRTHISVDENDAARHGLTEEDYALFLKILLGLFDNNKSTARPQANVVALYEFRHVPDMRGLRGEHLLRGIRVRRNRKNEGPARSFDDYTVDIHPSLRSMAHIEMRQLVETISWDDEKIAAE